MTTKKIGDLTLNDLRKMQSKKDYQITIIVNYKNVICGIRFEDNGKEYLLDDEIQWREEK